VEPALQSAHAKTTDAFGVSGPDADYVWGDLALRVTATGGTPTVEVGDLSAVRPGDIVQFRNYLQSNGLNAPHHTAIVEQNLGGGQFLVLQQNFGQDGVPHVVRRDMLDLSQMTQGTVWDYHPVPR
jgi:hypothetical protein